MNQKNNSTPHLNESKLSARLPNTILFTNVNLHQLHLTPSDLQGYETVYLGAAKDILNLVEKTIVAQQASDALIQRTNKCILQNESQRIWLSFFLAVFALFVGCYLSLHLSTPLQVVGIILLLAVCLSAFDVKILSWITKIFKNKT